MDERLQLDYKNYIKPIQGVRASQTGDEIRATKSHLGTRPRPPKALLMP
jgi:hypothetical protein